MLFLNDRVLINTRGKSTKLPLTVQVHLKSFNKRYNLYSYFRDWSSVYKTDITTFKD